MCSLWPAVTFERLAANLCKMHVWLHVVTYILTFPPPLWRGKFQIWNAASQAIVLILPQMKFNLQFPCCAFWFWSTTKIFTFWPLQKYMPTSMAIWGFECLRRSTDHTLNSKTLNHWIFSSIRKEINCFLAFGLF